MSEPSTLLLSGELVPVGSDSRNNIREIFRAWFEITWNIYTGLQLEGYSPYQVAVLAAVFDKSEREDIDHPLGDICRELKRVGDSIGKSGVHHHQDVIVYWRENALWLTPKQVH